MTWDEPDVPVSGYMIYYNPFICPEMYIWRNAEIGPYTVYTISELEPHSMYAVRVKAKSVDGRYGNLSEVVISRVKDRGQ